MYGKEYISFSQHVENMYSNEEVEENTHNLIEKLLVNADSFIQSKILGIGISFPGNINSSTGFIEDSSLLGGNINMKLIETVKDKFNLPVFMENNVNLCALNESLFGKGQNKSIVLFVFAGFGIGSGLTINGDMFLGATFAAGNIGHTVVDLNGKRCYCGSFGCLETIASYPALYEEFQIQVKLNGNEQLFELIDGGFSCSKVKQIMEEANTGEEIAIQIVKNIGSYVGVAISNLLGTINPDLIILGGDYLKVKDIIIEPIKKSIHARAWSIVKDTPMEITDFGEMVEAHGAVSLIIKKFLKYGPEYFDRK
jgi:predicted NBD/HSP70 family sugar kinase